MPNYYFPTQETRKKLIEELARQGVALRGQAKQQFDAYIRSLRSLNQAMDAQSAEGPDGLPQTLTKEKADGLQAQISVTAMAGESFLAHTAQNGQVPQQGLPGLVDRLQNMLSKDFDTLGAYTGEPPLSLPELQEAARTLTVDLRGRKLETVGNLTSSRIKMTVVDSTGRERVGFFTKPDKVKLKSRYDKLVEEAKAACGKDRAAKAELDKLFGVLKPTMFGSHKFDGSPITEADGDDLIFSALMNHLQTHFEELQKKQLAPGVQGQDGEVKLQFGPFSDYMLQLEGFDWSKLPDGAKQIMHRGFGEFINDSALSIMGLQLGLKDGDRLDHRNAAMSAVADLLGVPKLVARADPMMIRQDDGTVAEGTFMDYADGLDLNGHPELMANVKLRSLSDPKCRVSLSQQIADLQVLDFLCMNEDRHYGNLSYVLDKQGNLVGIQAFDNDSSFGVIKKTEEDVMDLRVVTASMAEKIKQLDPEMHRFALRGRGLSEAELDAAADRLKLMQKVIREKKIEVVADEEMGERSLADFGTRGLQDRKSHRENLFDFVGIDMANKIKRTQRKIGTQAVIPGDPYHRKVYTTDRVYTVGGVKDTLDAMTRLSVNRETGFRQDSLVSWRGRSGNFKNLMRAVKATEALQNRLFEDNAKQTPKDSVSLNESSAKPLREQVDEAFRNIEQLANTYLEAKARQRKAEDIYSIRAKNSYEQSHIDYAHKILETVKEYKARTAAPETEQAINEHRAQQTLAQLRERRAEQQAQQNPQPQKLSHP